MCIRIRSPSSNAGPRLYLIYLACSICFESRPRANSEQKNRQRLTTVLPGVTHRTTVNLKSIACELNLSPQLRTGRDKLIVDKTFCETETSNIYLCFENGKIVLQVFNIAVDQHDSNGKFTHKSLKF